jgi:glycosyltransferase involved in cell wall biosynthesis
MKALLISHTSDMNGAEQSLLDLAIGLVQKKAAIEVLCPNEGILTKKLRESGVPVRIFWLLRPQRHLLLLVSFFVLWFPMVLSLAVYIKQGGFDVVYNNTIDGLYGPFAAKLVGIPCIWHVREVKPRNKKARRFFSWLIIWLPKQTLFNSKATQESYSTVPHSHWGVIYNAINQNHILPPDYATEGQVTVGFAGQMMPHKRPERFLNAFALSLQEVPSLKGIMAGNGKLLPEMKTLASQLGIDNCVDIPGFIYPLTSFYERIDVFVLTSDQEPFGRVLVEAMAAYRPVIAASVGGVPEVILDGICGFLVPADDIAAYAEKIVTLATDPELRRRMGMAAHQWATENFSLSRYVDSIYTVLQESLASAVR